MSVEFLITLVTQFLVSGTAFFLAYRSFQKRRIQLGDEPTLPQYFVRKSTYWIGVLLYCSFIAALFWLLTWWWLPLEPLITHIVKNLRSLELVKLLNGLDGNTLIPLIIAVSYLLLIAWESKYNPLHILRDSIHDAFAMPANAVEVYEALMKSRLSAVDDDLKTQIAERLLIPSIDFGDFDKSSATVEYKWAHNCLLFEQIQNYAHQSSYRRLFNEPSMKWGEICISYNEKSEKVAIWKEAEPHYTKTVNLIKELDHLNSLLCRMLASVTVFGSANENEIWATVKKLGGHVQEARLKHTYKYMLIFTAAVAIGVMLGREISVSLHNAFLFPDNPLAHFDYNTLRWIAYAVPIYVIPITLVFISRTYLLRHQRHQSERNYGFYMAMMIMGFLFSTIASTLILELTFYRKESFNFLESLLMHLRWGILPALMCGYVAYRMDSSDEKPEAQGNPILAAALRFLGWGQVAVIIMLYATDNLIIPKANLRFILVGTAFFMVGLMGAAAHFKTTRTDE